MTTEDKLKAKTVQSLACLDGKSRYGQVILYGDALKICNEAVEQACREQREIGAELHIKITVDLRESLIGGEHEREKILENYRKGNTYKEFLNALSPIEEAGK